MTEETTLQTEIKRLETALDSLLSLSKKAEDLKKENEKQRQAHQASIDLIKKDYDAVLSMAEDLLKSVEDKPEALSETKNPETDEDAVVEAKNDNTDEEDVEEQVLIELGNSH